MTKAPSSKARKKPTASKAKLSKRKGGTLSPRRIEQGGALAYGFSVGGALVIGVLVGLAILGNPTKHDKVVKEKIEPEATSKAIKITPHSKPIMKVEDVAPITTTIEPAPSMLTSHGPMMAIVIDDMGMNADTSDKFARVGASLTFAFLPYAHNLSLQTRSIKRHGHELMVHMPMEPETWDQNPGPNALLRDLEPTELRKRMDWNLGQFEGFSGINNHMGSLFTQSRADMKLVMASLKGKGLYFLDSRTSPNSVAYKTAFEMGIPAMSRDVFLDNDRDVDKIKAQLEKAHVIANKKGWSISIGHPYPETLEALQEWLPLAKRDGVVFVPLSKLVYDETLNQQKMASVTKTPATSLLNPAQ